MPRAQHSVVFESFGLAVRVQSDDRELFNRLPTVLPPGWRPPNGTPISAQFALTRNGRITLDDQELIARTDDLNAALSLLGKTVRQYVAEHAPAHTFIHAAVAGARGVGIVIPGRSLSGKTMLVVELLRAGATYYSDEYAVIDSRGAIHPYPEPLRMRFDPVSGRYAVPVEVQAAQVGTEPTRAGLIVLTSYQQGANWSPAPRSPGEGALALLEHTVSARSRPALALAAVRRLAETARVIGGERGEASLAAQAIMAILP